MKKTLLCLAIGIAGFYIGIFAQGLFYWEEIRIVEPAFDENETFNCTLFMGNFPSQEENNSDKAFSIIEGDYDSQQNKDLWMYLYSTSEDGKSIVEGDVRVGSKIYNLKSDSPFNPATGEFHFTTKRIGNFFYKFSGKSLLKNYKDGETVLEGKLEKIKNGATVEATKHKFKFYFHVCSQ